jgi:hypothetical protein
MVPCGSLTTLKKPTYTLESRALLRVKEIVVSRFDYQPLLQLLHKTSYTSNLNKINEKTNEDGRNRQIHNSLIYICAVPANSCCLLHQFRWNFSCRCSVNPKEKAANINESPIIAQIKTVKFQLGRFLLFYLSLVKGLTEEIIISIIRLVFPQLLIIIYYRK